LFGSLAFSWWTLVYWLFALLWYPPKVGPLGRFAIFYSIVVLGAIPVSLALVWVGRRLRRLPIRVSLAVATPALLWAALLFWGTHSMDRIHLSVIGVQAAVAVYFLTMAGLVLAAGRRWRVSKVAIQRSLGILLVSHIACYSIEVWRLTLYRHPQGGALLEHELFSKLTFLVAAMGTILCAVTLAGHGHTSEPRPEQVGRQSRGRLSTRRVVAGVVTYVWMVCAWHMTVNVLWKDTRYDSAQRLVGISLLPAAASLVCWLLARPFGRPTHLMSIRFAGQALNSLLIGTAGAICFFFASWTYQNWASWLTGLPGLWSPWLFRVAFGVAIVLSTAGFLNGVLARAGGGPWYAIARTAILATVSYHLWWFLLSPFKGILSWTWESVAWAFVGTGIIAWMTLRLGSIVPVGLFVVPCWLGLSAMMLVARSLPPDLPLMVIVGLFASTAVLICLGIGLSLRKQFVEVE